MLSHKKSLNILRKTDALLEGHFVLSSGLHSSKYIQCAKLLSYPHLAEKICKSLAIKIKKNFSKFDLILSPAMGGIIIGYEIGRILKKETIFCERVRGKFTLRRGFKIKKGFLPKLFVPSLTPPPVSSNKSFSFEIVIFTFDLKFNIIDIKGLEFNPILRKWKKSDNLSVNYIMCSLKN